MPKTKPESGNHHKTIILAGADINDYVWCRDQINQGDLIICADSGARHAKAMDIAPDIIIDDLDSIDPTLLDFYKGLCEIIHDTDQNTTDLMKALNIASQDHQIDIYGAIGERADHDFSNYLILMAMDHPDHITLRSKGETRRVVKSKTHIHGQIGDMIGIFPLSPVENLLFTGLKYPADTLNEPHQFGWNGACNELIHKSATITFDHGCILITHSIKGH